MRKLALLLGILFLLVSCEKESSTELTNSKDNQTALKGAKLGAPSENAVVYRYEDLYFMGLYDENRDLTAYLGIDISNFCATYDFWGSLDVVTVQEIYFEDPEWARIILHVNDYVAVSVFNGNPDNDPCEMEPLWEGTAHLIHKDNDVNPNGPNHNSFGLTAIGDGLSIQYHVVWDADWESEWDPEVAFTRIRLK